VAPDAARWAVSDETIVSREQFVMQLTAGLVGEPQNVGRCCMLQRMPGMLRVLWFKTLNLLGLFAGPGF
jgi:hypothetical protein